MSIRKTTAMATMGMCAVVGIAAYRIGRARADGVPTTSPLYYGGFLDDSGTPVTGPRNVTVRLWDMPSAGTAVCTTVAPATPFNNGRFRVELDPACATAVRASPDLWAEVLVDRTTLPRAKLGAVPYALEAGRAAAASGPLDSRIRSVESNAQPRQVLVSGTSGTASFTGTSYCGGTSGATSPATAISGESFTFTPTTTSQFMISTRCRVSGQADLSIGVVSSPAPSAITRLQSGANTYYYNSSTSSYSMSSVTIPVDAIGTFQAGVSYTVQVNAVLVSMCSGYSTSLTWYTSQVSCGALVVTQLN